MYILSRIDEHREERNKTRYYSKSNNNEANNKVNKDNKNNNNRNIEAGKSFTVHCK